MAELHEIEIKSCQATVEMIKYILEKAERGEIRSVAIATVNREGVTATCWHSENQWSSLLGSVTSLSHRLAAE